jgi:hypothetical protein
MSVAGNPAAVILSTIDAALWIAEQEEQRLMKTTEAKSSSANERFRALIELATFSRQINTPPSNRMPE